MFEIVNALATFHLQNVNRRLGVFGNVFSSA